MATEIVTRAEAQAQGLNRYFTGKPCKHGHIAERRMCAGCVECQKVYRQPYGGNLARRQHDIRAVQLRALALGEKTFCAPFPCKRGHLTERYTNGGGCVECKKEYKRKHPSSSYKIDIQRKEEWYRAYYLTNRERLRAGMTARYMRNRVTGSVLPEFIRTVLADAKAKGLRCYFTGKPCRHGHIVERYTCNQKCVECARLELKVSLSSQRRRARKRNALGSYTREQLRALLDRQKKRCANCRCLIGNKYHADHIEALSRGGSNDIYNIQLLCPSCNSRKGTKDSTVWAQQQGRLL
jgi:5-methylcytosine-specific restriction endonuclease McrA